VRVTRVTVPRGRKPLPPKTARSIARQLLLEPEDFAALVSCTLSGADYVILLRAATRD
jgi:hypothetical protein